MAEAIGIASGVAGLISLGLSVCKGILTYYNAFRDSQDDIGQMCSSVESVAKTLVAIDLTLQQGQFSHDIIVAVETSLKLCKEALETLAKKLDKIRSTRADGSLKTRLENAKRRMFYPFRESTLAKLREICHDLKDNLGLAINVLDVNAKFITQQHLDTLSNISSTLSKQVGHMAVDVASVTADIHSIRLEQEESAMMHIFAWLTPLTTNFRNKHQESLSTKVRQDSGAQQLLQSLQFKTWASSTGAALWCTGLPGIGKTINTSYIIDILRKERCNNDDVGIAYIYFSYKDTEIQTSVNILASLLEQLISRRPGFLSDLRSLYAEHTKENTRPSIADIGSLLQNIVFSFSKVFIIIDALDECAEVDDVRSITLTELKKLQHRMLLLVMSRPMPDPEGLLKDAIRINVEASLTDIRNYIEQRIDNTRSMQKHVAGVPELRHRIVTVILQKIKGMFLMARLYLDTLVTKTTRRKIKTALETLPEGLDSIYDELMIRIKLQNPKDHAELAMKVIGWIFYAARPLTVTEMQHALAIEQDDTYLDEDGIPNPDLLVSVCAGLVMINDNSNTISFVHYTTQEYFNRGGKRLLGSANGDIASTCLTYLRFDSFSRRIENLTNRDVLLALLHEYPLLSYASQHWGNHQRNAENERNDGQALELLRDENRIHTIAWLRDYANSLAKGTYFRPRAQVLGLALASSFGLTKVALNLIESSSSVNEIDSIGQTALHRASENGHAETAELLLKMGAQINSKDLAGWTPLHQASSGADEIMANLLIKHGADVNVVDGYNATPLYRAAEVGAEEITRLLLDNGADIRVRNTYLQTALHRAADRGHLPVVNLLLQYGADAGAKDHYGYTPFYRAADQGYEDIAKLLRTHMLAR
ncbi:26S proteasome non-ATPase regulatory subunit 10 [Trichoderma lentiforme]|uniref:26S proteasome non-ATPase regulatory subunit 10 n=1 Tax=Trichoderma lentiforme TaxID=1567552 RepID=A0A9P4XC08_9HYPO|nr:26S proteasome non-ATPase regulatory subunit 10 [Trichoderma lentiforme]